MSINACSINAQTINALCRRRQAPAVEQPLGHGSPNVRDLRALVPPRFEIEDQPVLNFELADVTVLVELPGQIYQQTLHVADTRLEFVTVTDLQLAGEDAAVTVNITDLDI